MKPGSSFESRGMIISSLETLNLEQAGWITRESECAAKFVRLGYGPSVSSGKLSEPPVPCSGPIKDTGKGTVVLNITVKSQQTFVYFPANCCSEYKLIPTLITSKIKYTVPVSRNQIHTSK